MFHRRHGTHYGSIIWGRRTAGGPSQPAGGERFFRPAPPGHAAQPRHTDLQSVDGFSQVTDIPCLMRHSRAPCQRIVRIAPQSHALAHAAPPRSRRHNMLNRPIQHNHHYAPPMGRGAPVRQAALSICGNAHRVSRRDPAVKPRRPGLERGSRISGSGSGSPVIPKKSNMGVYIGA